MCSGIGPAKHLKEHGINVVSDLAGVGGNLQDHPAAVVSFRTPVKGVSVTSKLRFFGMQNPLPILRWFLFKSGLLTSTGCDHGAFVRTSASTDGQADLQIRFLAARALGPDGMTTYTQFRINRGSLVSATIYFISFVATNRFLTQTHVYNIHRRTVTPSNPSLSAPNRRDASDWHRPTLTSDQ